MGRRTRHRVGTRADACVVGACIGFAEPGCCTVHCEGKSCGGDGCSGLCGTCNAGQACDDTGTCVQAAAAGDTCADAVVIAALPFTASGDTTGLANDHAVPASACHTYALGTFGPDATYRYTADFTGYLRLQLTGLTHQADVYALRDCADTEDGCTGGTASTLENDTLPVSVPVAAGEPLTIVVDTSAPGPFTLSVTACVPDCAGRECGLDGCGHWCATCPKLSTWQCSTANTCVCLPSCSGKVCGDDGCGGSCGPCAAAEVCDGWGATCVKASQPGDRCETAITAKDFPFEYTGTTLGLGNDYYGWGFCDGNGTGAPLGIDAPVMVFRQEPTVATTYYAHLQASGFAGELWALTDCADPVTCIQAGYKGAALQRQLFIEAAPGVPTFIAVSAHVQGGGPFTLTTDACHAPGDCPAGTPGDYCSYANPTGALPYGESTFSIGSAVDAYAAPTTGPCALPTPSGPGAGDGGAEDVYAFTSTTTGPHTVTVAASGQLDPVLYVTTDCTHLATACVAAADATDVAQTETLTFDATAGTTCYLIVDGFTGYAGAYELAVTGP